MESTVTGFLENVYDILLADRFFEKRPNFSCFFYLNFGV